MILELRRRLFWLLAISTAVGVSAHAVERVTVTAAGQDWNDPSIWSPTDGLAPHDGDTYIVTLDPLSKSSATISSPVDGNDVVFGGDSLTLLRSGTLLVHAKAPGQATTLTFGNKGLIANAGFLWAQDDVQFTISGLITAQGVSGLILDTTDWLNGGVNRGSFKIDAEIRGTGYIRYHGGSSTAPSLELTNSNRNFSGVLHIEGGWVKASGVDSLGSSSLYLESSPQLGRTIFDADYDIVSQGALIVQYGSMIRLDQHLTFNSAYIQGSRLEPGTYSANELRERFPNSFAEIGQGSTADGKLTVALPEPSVAGGILLGVALFASRRKRN